MTDTAGERWEILPALTLLEGVLFPGARCCVQLETLAAYGAVKEAVRSWGPKALAVFAARGQPPSGAPADLFEIGAAAEVLSLQRQPCCRRWIAEIRAVGRLRACAHLQLVPFRIARIERLLEPSEDAHLLQGLLETLREAIHWLATLHPGATEARRTSAALANTTDPSEALGHAMNLLRDLSVDQQQEILQLPLMSARLGLAIERTHELLARPRPPRLQLAQ